MMDSAKYIVVDTGLNELPIIFPNFITHLDMASKFGGKWLALDFATSITKIK